MTNSNSSEPQDELENFYRQSSQQRDFNSTNSSSQSSDSSRSQQQSSSSHQNNSSSDPLDPLEEFYRHQDQNYGANASFVYSELQQQGESPQAQPKPKPNPDSYFDSPQQVKSFLSKKLIPEQATYYGALNRQHPEFAQKIPHRALLSHGKFAIIGSQDSQLSVRISRFVGFILGAFALLFVVLFVSNFSNALVYDKYHDLEPLSTLLNVGAELLYYGIPAVLFWVSSRLTYKFSNELVKAYLLEQRHFCNHENIALKPTQATQLNDTARSNSTKVLSNAIVDRKQLAQKSGTYGVSFLRDLLCGTQAGIVSYNHFAEVAYHAQVHPELSALEIIDYYEEKFLSQLDAQAQEQIIKIAKRISVTTGISQWSMIDMLLIYIAAMKLVERIAQIYDVQISTAQRLLLARKILVLVAVGGVTEELSDSATELFSNGLVAKYLGDVTQGLANGVLMMRFGLKTIEMLRPLPYQAQRPTMVSMLKAFMKFSKKVDPE